MIRNIKWKPKYGEKYYYIDISGLGSLPKKLQESPRL